jgi:hypothetical protein
MNKHMRICKCIFSCCVLKKLRGRRFLGGDQVIIIYCKSVKEVKIKKIVRGSGCVKEWKSYIVKFNLMTLIMFLQSYENKGLESKAFFSFSFSLTNASRVRYSKF